MMYFPFLCFLLSLLLSFHAHAVENKVTQTKTKMLQLDNKIKQLKKTLTNAHDIHLVLDKELASTEKKISESIRTLRLIQQDIATKQQKINYYHRQEIDLNKQLINQQQLLAEHVRTFYKMGEYQPLKWVLNQDDPYAISRLLTFYQYLVHSRQSIIDDISTTKENLAITKDKLQQEIIAQRTLKENLDHSQQQLEHSKVYHQAVIHTLNNEIQTKERRLTEYQQNKDNLTQLLKTFLAQSSAYSQQPFTASQHKLPLPVGINKTEIKPFNQGVTFFAPEGTPVSAVASGKVVFSDWLNGYGLLMIIDHGQGFMTLYAHNESLFKRKGALVTRGETIATVGHSGGLKQNGLYFEIRKGGKTVPPLAWLS